MVLDSRLKWESPRTFRCLIFACKAVGCFLVVESSSLFHGCIRNWRSRKADLSLRLLHGRSSTGPQDATFRMTRGTALRRRRWLRPGSAEEFGVLGDAGNAENLCEVRREAEGANFLGVMVGLHQELNDQRDAAGIDVAHLGEIEKDQLGGFFGKALIAALEFLFGGGGDVAVKTEDEYRVSSRELSW